jgi:TRAP transporter T-component
LETVAALPRLAAMVARLIELDDTYFYGAPHLLQAVQYASRSPLLGGDPRQAQEHFGRADALSQGRLLLVPLLEAQYYAVQTQDRPLFTTRLEQVLQAPDTLLPEQAFLNTVAKQRAALLLRRIDELFP